MSCCSDPFAFPFPSFRRKPESILRRAAKINIDSGFRRNDGNGIRMSAFGLRGR